jgi:hypothetical protein
MLVCDGLARDLSVCGTRHADDVAHREAAAEAERAARRQAQQDTAREAAEAEEKARKVLGRFRRRI